MAVKSNDNKSVSSESVLDALACGLGLSIPSIVDAEFGVFAALRFRLAIPAHQYLPHLERILAQLGYTSIQEYLGERMYQQWTRRHQGKHSKEDEEADYDGDEEEDEIVEYSHDDYEENEGDDEYEDNYEGIDNM